MTILKQVRRSQRMSQEELADAAGVSRSAVQYAERTGSMRPETAKKLAKVLGVEWSIFFDDAASFSEQGTPDPAA